VREIVTEGKWCDQGLGERIVKQLCRELLLLESSDWQFLITTEAARDYAEQRFLTHLDQFREVGQAWDEFFGKGSLAPETEQRLAQIEQRDSLFEDIDPSLWARRKGRG
jgi:1,4-alpha-glucan branching enzyme